MINKRFLLLFLLLFCGIISYAAPDTAQGTARVNKKAVLAALAEVQQQQMVPRTNLIKNFFPALINNAPIVGKYNDLASLRQGVGKARADEILAQTDDAISRTDKWLTEINAYYKKEGIYPLTNSWIN